MSSPTRLHLAALGRAARNALANDACATLFARFERSAYVASPGGIACIGTTGIGEGPLNAWLAPGAALPPLGAQIVADLSGAQDWAARARQRRGLERASLSACRACWASARPADGLASLVDAPSRVAPRARTAAAAFFDWLAHGAHGEAPQRARALLGMGPGLTPAGDDLIGGALIALHACGRKALALRAAVQFLPHAATRTGRISVAHLACAAVGAGHAALHDFLDAIGDATQLATAFRALGRIGHTSGWDAAAGAVLALEAIRPSGRRAPGRRPAVSRRDRATLARPGYAAR